MRNKLLLFILLLICPVLVAQQALNNDAVIKLVKAGLSDDVIVSNINAKAGVYDTSTDGIIALKNAGASDKVIAAVLAKGSAPAPGAAAPAATATPAASGPNDPAAPHASGAYMYTANTMTQLGSTEYQTKTKQSIFNNSSIKITAIVGGEHASIQGSDPGVVFYFYTGENDTSAPDQFVLLRLQSQGGNRETEFTPAGLMKAGATFNDNIPFMSAKAAPGIYKLTPSGPLQPGEYCFFTDAAWYGATLRQRSKMKATGRVYDFGVR